MVRCLARALVLSLRGGHWRMEHEHEARELFALRKEVESLRRAIELLYRISTLVAAPFELEPTCYAVLTAVTAPSGLGLDRAMIFFIDKSDREVLAGAYAVGPADADEADRNRILFASQPSVLEALAAMGLRHQQHPSRLDREVRAARISRNGMTPIARCLSVREPLLGGSDDAGGLFDPSTAIAVRLGGAEGVLYADNRFSRRVIDSTTQLVFAMIAELAGRTLVNALRHESLADEARTDALTGLLHHGAFVADLARELRQASVAGRPLGLLMVDLDGFKPINDQMGHLAGDALLAALSLRMRGMVRSGGGIYRYGGDEFAVVLPGADRASAERVGSRIHKVVSELPFSLQNGIEVSVTCSVGVASFPEHASRADDLIAAADTALIQAKAKGKNRVICAGQVE